MTSIRQHPVLSQRVEDDTDDFYLPRGGVDTEETNMVSILIVFVGGTSDEVVGLQADVIWFAEILNVAMTGKNEVYASGDMAEGRRTVRERVPLGLGKILGRMMKDRYFYSREITIERGHLI